MKIGVLALQGAFSEHIHMLGLLGVDTAEVRLPEDLADLDGLIIPGGESTTSPKRGISKSVFLSVPSVEMVWTLPP